MTSANQAAYQALREYLNSLLSSTHPDQALGEVPAALRPSLEAFMRGKTEYQDEIGRRMIYAYDLAAWASDLIHGAGLTTPLPLATMDVAALRAENQALLQAFGNIFDTEQPYSCASIARLKGRIEAQGRLGEAGVARLLREKAARSPK